jgi:hypothetical protein
MTYDCVASSYTVVNSLTFLLQTHLGEKMALLGKERAVDNNKPGDLVTQSLYYQDILYTVQ